MSKKLLIIHLSGLGNSILFIPILRGIRNSNKELIIEMVVREKVIIDLFDKQKLIDKWYYYERPDNRLSRLFSRIKLFRDLSKSNYDFLISTEIFQSINNLLAISLLKAERKIGIAKNFFYDSFYSDAINYSFDIKETIFYENLFRRLSPDLIVTKTKLFSFHHAANKYLSNVSLNKRIVGIHAGCGKFMAHKRWESSKFKELCSRLASLSNIQLLLFGGNEEKDLSQEITENIKSEDFFDFTGKLKITETAEIISKCNLFISNDSGLMHLAALVGVSNLAIFGPTSVAKNSPLGSNSLIMHKGPCDKNSNVLCKKCIKAYKRSAKAPLCLRNVSVDEVFAASLEILGLNHV